MNDKRILKNIGVGMLMKPISILLSMVYAPLALSFLGDEKYGVWAIILNVVSWIAYFDIGIGNGLRNHLARAYAQGNETEAKTYVSTAYVGTSIISTGFFLIVAVVWNIFDLGTFFKMTAPGENVNFVVTLSVLFVCINFVLSLSKTSAYAIQQPGWISVISAGNQLLQLIILFVLSRFLTENLLVVALMYGVVNIVDSMVLFWILSRKHPYLKPSFRMIDVRHLKSLFTLGMGFFIMQISSMIMNTTSNLLISNLYGSAEVTPYSMVYKVFNMAVQVHAIIIMPMWSAYTEAAARNDMAWIKATIKKVNLITLLLSAGVVVGIFLFEPFAALWLGRRLEYGTALIVIVALYMIMQMFASNYSAFLCGVGHIKVSVIIAAAGAVLNIPLAIFFASGLNMRLAGITLGSLCVVAMSAIALPIVTAKWISQQEKEWSGEQGGAT